MCTTDEHDVRRSLCRIGPDGADDGLLLALRCFLCAWLTELVEADSAPEPPSAAVPAVAPDAGGTGPTPARPAQATTRTPRAPTAAVRPGTPGFARCLVRIRRQARASAPCRTGSSTNFHDSAAMPMLAAIWARTRGRYSAPFAGEVSTMTG